MKVLLIDDTTTTRMIVQKTVARMGIENFQEVHSESEAALLLENSEFDTILFNWNLLGINGLDCIETIRNFAPNANLVMLVKECHRSEVVRAVQLGVDDYLTTPLSPSRLEGKIQSRGQVRETTQVQELAFA